MSEEQTGLASGNVKEVTAQAAPSQVAKLLQEFYGAFVLVCVINCSVAMGSSLAPLAIGMTLTFLVYGGGNLSGGHYNPAVSLAILIRDSGKPDGKKFTAPDFCLYSLSQVLGGIVGALAGYGMTGGVVTPGAADTHTTGQAFCSEVIFTMFLAHVVLNVACTSGSDGNVGNQHYGLAIGIAVLAGACSVGAVSGGAFNPAVATGLLVTSAIGGENGIGNLWMYWISNLLGGVLAAGLFMINNKASIVADKALAYENVGGDDDLESNKAN